MIIDKEKSGLQLSQDINVNKVSIKEEDANFIITLLSSNLYTNPIESFIRETVSNAYDSHVEAKTDDKILLKVIERENTVNVGIRDYGVGLSPERFSDIYTNLGSSTKRNTNEQIGGFGIGRFSALACSNTVNITSYYNGKKYSYLMFKDINEVHIDCLNIVDTTEKNGVEVSINIEKTFCCDIINAIFNQLSLFENVYVYYEGNNSEIEFNVDKFNNSKIKKFNNFITTDFLCRDKYKSRIKIAIGNVCYDATDFNLPTIRYVDYYYYNIYLKFNVGDLPITPNRESIIVTKESSALVNDKLNDFKDEIKKLFNSEFNPNINDFREYYKYLSDGYYKLNLIGENNIEYNLLATDFNFQDKIDGTYKDAAYDNISKFRKQINSNFQYFNVAYSGYGKYRFSINQGNYLDTVMDPKIKIVIYKRKQIIKKLSINESKACEKYLDTKGYDSYVVLKNDINIKQLLKDIFYNLPVKKNKEIFNIILRELIKIYKSKLVYITEDDVNKYRIINYQPTRKESSVIFSTMQSASSCRYNRHASNIDELRTLTKLTKKRVVVFSDKELFWNANELFYIPFVKNTVFICTANRNIKKIADLKNVITFEDYIKKYKYEFLSVIEAGELYKFENIESFEYVINCKRITEFKNYKRSYLHLQGLKILNEIKIILGNNNPIYRFSDIEKVYNKTKSILIKSPTVPSNNTEYVFMDYLFRFKKIKLTRETIIKYINYGKDSKII